MNSSPDYITIREAALRSERSVSTIRRWIRQGTIESKQVGGKTSPVLVSIASLTAVLMTQEPRGNVDTSPPIHEHIHEQSMVNRAVVEAMESHIHALSLQVEDLIRDKTLLRSELESTRERLSAVEKELNGGVRGLLRSWIRKS